MKKLFSAFLIFLFLPLLCIAASVDFPSIEPLFISEKLSSEYSPLQIIEDSLRFSGCSENSLEWQNCVEKYNSLQSKILDSVFQNLSESEKAQKILSIMYENLLVQYRVKQTRLDVMFQNGTYNCVSSSLLYMALAKSAGLSVVGVKTPSHAFCSVFIDGEKIDVETTNPLGFNPGRTQILEKNGNSTRYAVIPKKNYSNRRDVSIKTFISLVGANLTSFYVEKNDYKNAVPMGATVLCFRNGENEFEISDAKEVFDVPALNFSVLLEKQGLYADSVEWLLKIIGRYGTDSKIQISLDAAANNAIADFSNKGDFASADQILENCNDFISADFRIQAQKMIFLSRTQAELDKFRNDEEALDFILQQYKNKIAAEKSVRQTLDKWQEFYWVNLVNTQTNQKNYQQASKIADDGLKSMPNNQNIKRAKSQAWLNHDAEIHNKMAVFANNRQYDKAMEILEQGLAENPSSITLQNDKKRLERMR